MSLVTQEVPSNIAYNISVGINVWMPSEHITFVLRHANPEGPVLAGLEQVQRFPGSNDRLTLWFQGWGLHLPMLRPPLAIKPYY